MLYYRTNFFIISYNWSQITRIPSLGQQTDDRVFRWTSSQFILYRFYTRTPKNSVLILLIFNQFFYNDFLRRSSLTPNTFIFLFTKTISSANIVHQSASSDFSFVSSSIYKLNANTDSFTTFTFAVKSSKNEFYTRSRFIIHVLYYLSVHHYHGKLKFSLKLSTILPSTSYHSLLQTFKNNCPVSFPFSIFLYGYTKYLFSNNRH